MKTLLERYGFHQYREGEGAGAGAAGNGGAGGADGSPGGTPGAGEPGAGAGSANENGSVFALDDAAFTELDKDSRGWLAQQGYATDKGFTPQTVAKLAKQAREQEKLIGSSIRVPGPNASQEEKDQFLAKLGRPEKADGYQFKVPEGLPENLPYDGERANAFKSMAHQLGLTPAQAASIHDWYVGSVVEDFNGQSEVARAAQEERARAETDKLVKAWGPLDGDTFKTNMELAHRFIDTAGDQSVMAELKRLGAISEDGMILSEPIARLFAKAGTAFYKEDGVVRGKRTALNNPFDRSSKDFNETQQMLLVRRDPDTAYALIAAAGAKPEDFGLKPRA